MAHLTHKLPWSSLLEALRRDPEWRMRRAEERAAFDKKAAHFVGALSGAIDEFARSDTRSDADKAAYDVFQWDTGVDEVFAVYGINALVGFHGSVLGAYVVLNLLVQDEERVRPAFFGENMALLAEPAGFNDGGHPAQFADLLLPLLDRRHLSEHGRYSKLEPVKLTPAVVDGLRRYCAELFRIMYTRPDVFTRASIEDGLWWVFKRLFKRVGQRTAP